MRQITLFILVVMLLVSRTALHAADTFLVKDGRPRAEIVIDEQPPRAVRLAASELQSCVESISGAKLPISTTPNGNDVVPMQHAHG